MQSKGMSGVRRRRIENPAESWRPPWRKRGAQRMVGPGRGLALSGLREVYSKGVAVAPDSCEPQPPKGRQGGGDRLEKRAPSPEAQGRPELCAESGGGGRCSALPDGTTARGHVNGEHRGERVRRHWGWGRRQCQNVRFSTG